MLKASFQLALLLRQHHDLIKGNRRSVTAAVGELKMISLAYLFPHDFQMADVILETRFPQTELITQALQLGTQLLLIFHRLAHSKTKQNKTNHFSFE